MTKRQKDILWQFAAALPPFAALGLQWALWDLIYPFVWFLFFPAVYLSAWMGGLRAGLGATLVATLTVWLFFVPPLYSLVKEPRYLFPAAVFFGMGVLFSVFHGRLKRATQQAAEALASAQSANERLESANRQITQLYERTKQLDDLKTQFFASVSHELRTPLALILGPTERLLGSPEVGVSAHEELGVVARNARLLLRHVNELLDVAKIEAGRMKPEHADVDLARLARLVAASFETVAEERGIALVVETPHVLRAEVDPHQIESVLTNLLSNAIKFTPESGRVRMTLTEEAARDRVVLQVADSGPGIPPDKRDAIFERFVQLDGGATRKRGGTGLGLAIVRDFVSLHGGEIEVGEAPEGGSLFRVDLPRRAPMGAPVRARNEVSVDPSAHARQLAEELRSGPLVAPGTTQSDESAPLVLVVEDNRDMNEFICAALAADHRVARAFDGKEGLERAIVLAPDLVLTDLMMPEMSGEDLVRSIRRVRALERTPIVVLTAKADDELRIRMLREGASDCLTKPFSIEELRARVLNLITRKRVEEELRRSRADLNRAQAVALIGSWRLDVRRNELTWSEENHRIFGIPVGTPLTYETFLATVHPDDRGYVDRKWKAALEGEPYDIEHRIVVGGDVRWVNERADLEFNERGQFIGGIGITQDITDRKKAEDALRAAQQRAEEAAARLRALHDANAALSDALAAVPESSVNAVMSAIAVQARALTGAEYSAIGLGTDPEKPFEPWAQAGVPAEVADRLGRAPRPVGSLGVVARDNRDLRLPDVRKHPLFGGFPPGHPVMKSFLGVPIVFRGQSVGNLYLANKQGAPEFSADDQILVEMLAARAGAALEIARLFRAEGAGRAWLQTVVDQMPEGVLLLDADGRVTAQNRSLRALSSGDLGVLDPFGNPVPLAFHFADGTEVPVAELPYVKAMHEGETFSAREYQLRQRDAHFVPVRVSVSPVQAPGGERTGAAMIVQDVTVLKALERMREEWTSVVAHDLRQPVNTITLAADLLKDSPSDEMRHKAATMIGSAASSLNRMIGDLLDASRIEARRMTIERREVSLPEIVRRVLDHMPDIAPRCDLEVTPGSGRPVWADAGRLEQVVTNLLSNAAKYGEPRSRIGLGLVARDHDVELTVTNRGAGIPAEELPHLFERFTRTRGARRGRAAGIGLGLYICRGLVEAHDGRIWAESTLGETTRFHFTIPFAPRRDAAVGMSA